MTHPGRRALFAIFVAACAAQACAVAEEIEDGEDPGDTRRDDSGGSCDPAACLRTCLSLGASGGTCVEGACDCGELDGPVDVDLDDAGGADVDPDAPPPACDPTMCNSACISIGLPGGTCVGDDCNCGTGPDADADADTDADDAPPPPDEGPDVPPVDDAGVEDAPVDDARDDAVVDEGTTEDTGAVWGVPTCNTTGGTLRDRGIFGATTLTQSVVVPAMPAGRAVRLEITLNPRRILIAPIPWTDVQAQLQAPSGTRRTFWKHFEGDPSGMLGDYAFFTPWVLPVWWGESAGGTWTLTLTDDEMSGTSSTLVSWCVTPLDPATHASTDTGAHMAACDMSSHSIGDYACDADGGSCEHPLTIQLQASDMVRAAGTPNIRLETGHGDVSQLRIDLIGADGSETVVWNRGAGPLPATIPISAMTGAWMTGRYQLTITDMVAGTSGSLTRFCVEAN
jgi:subtilisin-like proprotein convertase family protein